MEQLTTFLFWVSVAIFFWAGTGHLLWLVIAWVFRVLFSSRCPQCGEKFSGIECARCKAAGQRQAAERSKALQPTVQDDLRAAKRLLQFARFHEWLGEDDRSTLERQLDRLEARVLLAPTAPKPAEPAPPVETTRPTTPAPMRGAPAEQQTLEAVSPTPTEPTISVADMFQSFMEKANIRWVELISASLIVICSVGLVISLWNTLSSTSRLFPSLIFLLATLAVHGAGQYTLRQWKLRSTSRGILHIGLMLIPLAVLVGLLLARRQEAVPRFDLPTIAAIALGGLIYGALAITTCRTLFASRWWLAAGVLIIACATLLPIHFAVGYQQLHSEWAAALLLPLAVANVLATLGIGPLSMAMVRSAAWQRVAGILLQGVFATGVVLVFWLMQAKPPQQLSEWWWLSLGTVCAGWTAWSWGISSSVTATRRSTTEQGITPEATRPLRTAYVALGWAALMASGTLLIAAIWSVADLRWASVGLLAVVSAVWSWHGYRCRTNISSIAGGVCGLCAAAFVSEAPFAWFDPLLSSSWLGLPRVLALTGVGMAGAMLSLASLSSTSRQQVASRLGLRRSGGEANYRVRAARRGRMVSLPMSWLIASGLVLLASVVLTLMASLLPIGPTPFGGQWAGGMLLFHGALAIAVSLLSSENQGSATASIVPNDRQTSEVSPNITLSSWLLPLGQGLLLLATIRITQSNTLLSEWLVGLRTERQWGVGVAMLATLWCWLAAFLRTLRGPKQLDKVYWLAGGGIVATIVSSVVLWTNDTDLSVALRLGWLLPLAWLGATYAWRINLCREICLMCVAAWLTVCVQRLGVVYAWWTALGWLASASVRPVAIVALTAVVDRLLDLLPGMLSLPGSEQPTKAEHTGAASTSGHVAPVEWNFHSRWAMPLLCWGAWGVLISSGAPACFQRVADCLGYGSSDVGSVAAMLGGRGNGSLFWYVASAMLLVASCAWHSVRSRTAGGIAALGLFPIVITMGVMAWVEPPYSLIAGLWTLAGWMIIGEAVLQCPALVGGSIERRMKTWVGWSTAEQYVPVWGGMLGSLLLALSISQLPSLLSLGMPVELLPVVEGSWSTNLPRMLWMLGPVALASMSRWGWSLWRGDGTAWSFGSASISSMSIAIGVALAIPVRLSTGDYDSWPTLVVGMSVLATALSLYAWLGLIGMLLRNVFSLRALAGVQLGWRTLLDKSLRGRRFAAVEEIARSLMLCVSLPLGYLVGNAFIAVVHFPIGPLTGLPWLGSRMVLLAFGISLPLLWLGWRRHGLHHTLLATIGLGLLTPLAAAWYANLLVVYPSWRFPTAAGFEPWRLNVGLWLLVLAVDLLWRYLPSRFLGGIDSPNRLNWHEQVWQGLGAGVITLCLVGLRQDPHTIWPTLQLFAMGLLLVVSGGQLQQAWRGQLAAVLAAAGVMGWMFSASFPKPVLYYAANVMWGPMAIALLSVALRRLMKRRPQSPPSTRFPLPHFQHALSGLRSVSVEWSTSLLVPLTLSGLSLIVSFALPSQLGTNFPTWLWGIVGLSACSVLLSVGRLWEAESGKRGLAVYLSIINLCLMLAVVVGAVNGLSLLHRQLLWLTALQFGMAVMAALLRELSREASALRHQLRLGSVTDASRYQYALNWMPEVHTVVACLCLVPCFTLVLSLQEQALRIAATALPLVGAASVLPISTNRSSSLFRSSGLFLVSCSLLLLFWAQLPAPLMSTTGPAIWMFVQRSFLAGVTLSAVYRLLAYIFAKGEGWSERFIAASWLTGGAGCVLGWIAFYPLLPTENAVREWVTELALPDKLWTLLAWLAIAARLLLFAVKPHAVEAGASIPLRKGAVFASEFALVGLGLGTLLHFPHLFSGLFLAWWPVIVLFLAMLSVGLGEFLRRIEQPVLCDPVHQSSLLLPLIPLAGVGWLAPQNVDWLWNEAGGYSLLLLGAAALYATASWTRESPGLRAVAGGLSLLSFWFLLHSYPSLRFFEHPQLWLLPPAIATLGFLECNRGRLPSEGLAAARYVCLLVAYLSSASEVLLKAFEGQLWQPLLLLTLSLIGIGVGIALRVKAFMLCGAVFTFVALLGMVWHAHQAIGQVWPWWAFGIATGIALISCLGYFEKNRQSLLERIERWKQWDN